MTEPTNKAAQSGAIWNLPDDVILRPSNADETEFVRVIIYFLYGGDELMALVPRTLRPNQDIYCEDSDERGPVGRIECCHLPPGAFACIKFAKNVLPKDFAVIPTEPADYVFDSEPIYIVNETINENAEKPAVGYISAVDQRVSIEFDDVNDRASTTVLGIHVACVNVKRASVLMGRLVMNAAYELVGAVVAANDLEQTVFISPLPSLGHGIKKIQYLNRAELLSLRGRIDFEGESSVSDLKNVSSDKNEVLRKLNDG